MPVKQINITEVEINSIKVSKDVMNQIIIQNLTDTEDAIKDLQIVLGNLTKVINRWDKAKLVKSFK